MPVAARLKLGAALLLGLSLGSASMAQEAGQPVRTWIDPPARGAAVSPEPRPAGEAAARPAGQNAPAAASARSTKATATVAGRSEPRAPRHARHAIRTRVAARPAHRTLVVTALHPTRERAARPFTMRRSYGQAPREARMMDYALPVGRVEGPAPFGFRTGDDRIRAARAAGYIVMHARSVEFPDGRSLRTYQPVWGEGDED